MTTFPNSSSVITGAGVQEAFTLGFPKNLESPLLEIDFAGREHKEIDFSTD